VVRAVQRYTDSAHIEAGILRRLHDAGRELPGTAHIVQLFDEFMHRGHACLVYERCGLSLFEFLRRNAYQGYVMDDLREIAFQLVHAVAGACARACVMCDV